MSADGLSVHGLRDTVTLLPHQKVGVSWMRDREAGDNTGGIIANEMGLGKTILGITRILDHLPTRQDRANGFAKATLIVCPVTVVKQWKEEISKFATALRTVEYFGRTRGKASVSLREASVVITSYETLSAEYSLHLASVTNDTPESSSEDGKRKPLLFMLKWWRIILDEAHRIKSRASLTSKACTELVGKFRWCFTATPIQNDVEELFALFRFLKLQPFGDWDAFKTQIVKPMRAGHTSISIGRLRGVLREIMLRRTKTSQAHPLPARTLYLEPCPFHVEEQAEYGALEKLLGCKAVLSKRKNSNSMPPVLELILRLRQACNHHLLASTRPSNDLDRSKDPLIQYAVNLSRELDDLLEELYDRRCASCNNPLSEHPTRAVRCKRCGSLAAALNEPFISGPLPSPSSKIRRLLELLHKIHKQSNGQEKTIVFSHFTSMLDLVGRFLAAEGVVFTRYDGSMSTADRERNLDIIRNSTTTRCMLMSVFAGSLGLNLTECNNVILLEPWWNPALEEQAFGRVHRIGQKQPVNIYKLFVPGTIEERILQLQDKKTEIAKSALSKRGSSDVELAAQDVNYLLGV